MLTSSNPIYSNLSIVFISEHIPKMQDVMGTINNKKGICLMVIILKYIIILFLFL